MSNNNIIISAFHKDYIKITFNDTVINLEHLPKWMIRDYVMIKIYNVDNKCVFKKYKKITIPYQTFLPTLADGEYTFHLYYKSINQSNCYIGINPSSGFPLQIINGSIFIVTAKPFEQNKKIYLELNDTFFISHNGSSVSYLQFIPEVIVALAHKITKDSFSNYDKILTVHNWVAENIYYDYDSLNAESSKILNHDALSVVNRRRTVCAGYSELTVTLLRAVGVHAINIDCFALGYTTSGGWDIPSNMRDKANHVITFAYADDRWLMMDTTWDSNNEYKNGKYLTKSGCGVSLQYFDATLAFFSYTHRFIK